MSFGILIFTMLLVFAFIAVMIFSPNINKNRDLFFRSQATETAYRMDQAVNYYIADIELFALKENLAAVASAPEAVSGRNRLYGILRQKLKKENRLSSIILMSANGRVIAESGAGLPHDCAFLANSAPKAAGKASVTVSPAGIYVLYALRAANGEAAGLLACKINIKKVIKKIYFSGLDAPNCLLSVSQNGNTLATLGGANRKGPGDVFPRSLNGNSGMNAGGVRETYSRFVRGRYIFFSVRSGMLGWTVDYAVPLKAYYSGLVELKNYLIAAAIIILWISIWAAMLVAIRISKPLMRLSEATRDFIGGNYEAPLERSGGHDEIGSLEDNFEVMRLKIKELVCTDPLTGVHNRRSLMQFLEGEVLRAARGGETLACIMVDIDMFKQINDTFGHLCGDAILVEVAAIMLRSVRNYDLVARYGGEEFVVICSKTGAKSAYEIAERIRNEVERCKIPCMARGTKLTLSAGISAITVNSETTVDMLLRSSDAALYEAKKSGRNRVVVNSGSD